jgi:fatty acid desaturase
MAYILLLKRLFIVRGKSLTATKPTQAGSDMKRPWLRDKDGLRYHCLALSYGVFGYGGGLALMAASSVAANSVGVLLLAHAMVISAYLLHECAHNIVFAENADNARLGACLSWITGSCYARYEDLRRKHFRHHVERADVIGFDYRRRIIRYPALTKLVATLEWAYIPAVEILLHGSVILLPFVDDHYRPRRRRIFVILALRATLFTLLGLVSVKALLLYTVAYMLFLTVLRFMDANQHGYVLVETRDATPLPDAALRDREYEYCHTYSNLLSMRYPLLNLFTLNFAYHNAHHDRPTMPWYRLPALHKALYGDDTSQVLSFHDLIKAYHRFRVARAFHPDGAALKQHGDNGPDQVGIDGISFLIPV